MLNETIDEKGPDMAFINGLTKRIKTAFDVEMPCWFEYLQNTHTK